MFIVGVVDCGGVGGVVFVFGDGGGEGFDDAAQVCDFGGEAGQGARLFRQIAPERGTDRLNRKE